MIDNLINQGKELATLQETKDQLEVIQTTNNDLKEIALPLMGLLTIDRQQALDRGLEKIVPLMTSLNTNIEELSLWLGDITDENISNNYKRAVASLTQVLTLSIVAVILAIILGIYLSNMISKPIRLVMDQMKSIASGDLTREPLKIKLKDEVGQLILATNDMADSMRGVLKKISNVSETVSSNSEELTQSANEVSVSVQQITMTMQEMAAGSEIQANGSSELSSHMTNFATMVQEANEYGEQIQDSSNKVLEMTQAGSELMNGSTRQMQMIDHW